MLQSVEKQLGGQLEIQERKKRILMKQAWRFWAVGIVLHSQLSACSMAKYMAMPIISSVFSVCQERSSFSGMILSVSIGPGLSRKIR